MNLEPGDAKAKSSPSLFVRMLAANPEDLCAALRAGALRRGLAVLQLDLFRILNFSFGFALDAVTLNHV